MARVRTRNCVRTVPVMHGRMQAAMMQAVRTAPEWQVWRLGLVALQWQESQSDEREETQSGREKTCAGDVRCVMPVRPCPLRGPDRVQRQLVCSASAAQANLETEARTVVKTEWVQR